MLGKCLRGSLELDEVHEGVCIDEPFSLPVVAPGPFKVRYLVTLSSGQGRNEVLTPVGSLIMWAACICGSCGDPLPKTGGSKSS